MGILFEITNKNYRPLSEDELAEYRMYEQIDRMNRKTSRPKENAEGYCHTCKSFTTNYNHRGECRECGTEVREGVEEE